jgi:hypothetical protein
MKRNLLSGLQLLGACTALGFAPAVFAADPQTPPDPAAAPQTPPDPTNDPATARALHPRISDTLKSYTQEPASQTRRPEAVQQSATGETGVQKPQRPDGQSSSGTRPIDPSEVQKVFGQQASVVDLKSLDSQEIESLQQRLKTLGFYKGDIDGIAGPQTRAALGSMVQSQFTLAQRMIQQGAMPSQLAAALGIGPVDIQPTSGVSEPGDRDPMPPQLMPPQQSLPVPPEPKTAPLLPSAPGTNSHGDRPRDQNLRPPRPSPGSSPAVPPVDYPDAPTGHGEAPHG